MNTTGWNGVECSLGSVRERKESVRWIGDEVIKIVRVSARIGNVLQVCHEGAVKWEDVLVGLVHHWTDQL